MARMSASPVVTKAWRMRLLPLLFMCALADGTSDQGAAIYDDSNPAPLFQEYMTAATMPKLLVDVKTVYPSKARIMGFEGVVETYSWLTGKGDVALVRRAPGTKANELLVNAATEAAARRKYSPALNARGRPVNIWVRQIDSFSCHPHYRDTLFPPTEPPRPRPGSTLLDVRSQLWPGSNDLVRSIERVAVYCGDGVFWILWTYEPGDYAYAVRGSLLDKLGLYCKCVRIDGSVIVPPMRIAASAWSEYGQTSGFAALALPDGGLLVFLPLLWHRDREQSAPLRPQVRPPGIVKTISLRSRDLDPSYVPPKGRTAVIAVDRRSRVVQTEVDDEIAVCFSWSDSTGRFSFISKPWRRLARYFELPPAQVLWRKGANDGRGRQNATIRNRAGFLRERHVRTARWFQAWFEGHSAVIPLHDGRLLLARAPSRRDRYDQFAGDTVIFYRLRSRDLRPVDSTIVSARFVAGYDFPGATTPRPVLASTTTGYSFFVQSVYGVKSFWLDRNGRPLMGRRTPARVGTISDFKNSTVQFISGDHWYGFTCAGGLCQEPPLAAKPHIPPEWMEPNQE